MPDYRQNRNVFTPVKSTSEAPKGSCLGTLLKGIASLGAGAGVGLITLELQLSNLPAVCHNEYILKEMPAACPEESAAYITAVIAAGITAAALYYGPRVLGKRMLP